MQLSRVYFNNGYYIRSQIAGGVRTFEVSTDGSDKLRAIGIRAGENIPRELFIALWQDGDAYARTRGSRKRPPDESPFPNCDCCSSFSKLSLILVRTPEGRMKAEITCFESFLAYGLDTDIHTSLFIRDDNYAKIAHELKAVDRKLKSRNAQKLGDMLYLLARQA